MSGARKEQLRLFLRMLLIVTLCFIWGNSLLSRAESAALSGRLAAWLRSIGIPVGEHFLRKLAHFLEFGVLGAEITMLLRLREKKGLQNLCYSALAAFFAAAADETIQVFTGRSGQLSDVLLDFCGAMTGILFCTLVTALAEKKHSPQ